MIFAYHFDINTKKLFQLRLELLKTHMKFVFAKMCFTKFTIEILEEINTSQKIKFSILTHNLITCPALTTRTCLLSPITIKYERSEERRVGKECA